MLVDSHCHLSQFHNPVEVLEQAAVHGVNEVMALSEDLESMRAVIALRGMLEPATRPAVRYGLGLHPVWIVEQPKAAVEQAFDFLAEYLTAADVLGEVGLDHKWARTPEAQQWQAEMLERQLALAAACGKPINLHSRRCLRQVMDAAIAFKERTGLNAQLHWFTQSKKLVRLCNAAGVYISVGPTVLVDEQTQAVALEIADALLLLETDAPVRIGDYPGHPQTVRAVAEKIAQLKGCCWEEVAVCSTENYRRYLGG